MFSELCNDTFSNDGNCYALTKGGFMMTDINKGENKFYVGDYEAEPLAEITFVPTGDGKLIIDHTVVSDELSGQGVAGELVEKVVLYAREEGKKIIPECAYAKRKIEEMPEFQDVLAHE